MEQNMGFPNQQQPQQMQPMGGQMGMGGNGQGQGNPQLDALCQQLLPRLIQMMGEQQANRPGGPMDHAGAYTEGQTAKPGSTEPVETPDKPPTTTESKPDLGKVGKPEEKPTMNSELQDLKAQLAQYREQNEALRGTVSQQSAAISELRKHNEVSAKAAKLSLYRMKLQQAVSEGYSLGDGEKIERHATRMMPMSPDEAMKYIEDLKGSATRVNVSAGGMQRYGMTDTIPNPNGGGDEAERYMSDPDNAVIASAGVTADMIRLTDLMA
jgi:hypothetical protein